MKKEFFINYIKIMYKWLKHIHLWYHTDIRDMDIFVNSILTFINDISVYIILEQEHFIITLIYFKRFLLIQSDKNPFIVFILSFIFCLKYWEENDYITHFVYLVLDKMKHELFKYEFELLLFNIPLNVDNDTYIFYQKLINYEDT